MGGRVDEGVGSGVVSFEFLMLSVEFKIQNSKLKTQNLFVEHVQHALGDHEAAGDVDGAEEEGDRTQDRHR
jgi:hypothetical protein